MYAAEGVTVKAEQVTDNSTGAAYIFVQDGTGANAIIVVAGAAGTISVDDVERNRDAIENAAVFMTQLEQPIPAACAGLKSRALQARRPSSTPPPQRRWTMPFTSSATT